MGVSKPNADPEATAPSFQLEDWQFLEKLCDRSVMNGRVVQLTNTRLLDSTLDLLYTRRIQRFWSQFHSGAIANSQLQSTQRYRYYTQSAVHWTYARSPLGLLSPVLGYRLPAEDLPFSGSRTVSVAQSQQHLTHCALTGTPSWSYVH
jgi:hypothetical protein